MNRRKFAKIWAALTGLSALPSWATAMGKEPVKITHIRIGLSPPCVQVSPGILRVMPRPEGPPPPNDEHNYDAQVIEDNGRFFYRVGNTTIKISEHQAHRVIGNPHLYYVTVAQILHYRIRHKRLHGFDYAERETDQGRGAG